MQGHSDGIMLGFVQTACMQSRNLAWLNVYALPRELDRWNVWVAHRYRVRRRHFMQGCGRLSFFLLEETIDDQLCLDNLEALLFLQWHRCASSSNREPAAMDVSFNPPPSRPTPASAP